MLEGNAGGVLVIPGNRPTTKDGRTINGSYFIHVRTIQEVEGIKNQIEFLGLFEMDGA